MIVVTGATGFVGRNLVKELVREGVEVRCVVRRTSAVGFLEDLGVNLVYGDITDKESLLEAVKGAEKCISLVGILFERSNANFQSIHVNGVANLVHACKEKGVKDFIHVSALGTRSDAQSVYHRTKWEAEELIRGSSLNYTIFRPSVIFGKEDNFTNLFAGFIKLLPVVNIPGSGNNLMQPVLVKDLVKALAMAVSDSRYRGAVYEIGGADKLTFNEIIDTLCKVLGKWRLKVHIPVVLLKPGALLMEAFFPHPLITRDQLLMLQEDNVTDKNALKDVFHIEPVPFEEGIRSYL
jgi:uncharacterized protein YbjT (DUF2867 family)